MLKQAEAQWETSTLFSSGSQTPTLSAEPCPALPAESDCRKACCSDLLEQLRSLSEEVGRIKRFLADSSGTSKS